MANFKYFVILLLLLISCIKQKNRQEQQISYSLNKIVKIDNFKYVHKKDTKLTMDEFKSKYHYYSLIYVRVDCGSCYQKFIDWEEKMDTIIDNYAILFIINGENYFTFIEKVKIKKEVNDKFFHVIDSNNIFLEVNNKLPDWIFTRSVLINSNNNKIMMIGEPFGNLDMKRLFNKIINKKPNN